MTDDGPRQDIRPPDRAVPPLGVAPPRAPDGRDEPSQAGFGQYSPVTTLVVLDQGGSISISFDDLLKYHGRSSIAGVAHAFKAMERAFPLLSPGEPPERSDITVESGFPGGGACDAFEMVTRAVTGDRYAPASEPVPPGAPEAPGGHFFFRLGYRGRLVEVVARAELVPDDFVQVACREAPTPAEAARAQQLKEEMAERLLSLRADEVYDASVASEERPVSQQAPPPALPWRR